MTKQAIQINNYKANNKRFYSGSTVVLQWLYSGSTVALQWLYSGSTVALQWLYSSSTMALQWLYSGSTMKTDQRLIEYQLNSN